MDMMALLPFLQLVGAGVPQGGPLLQSPDPRKPAPTGLPLPGGMSAPPRPQGSTMTLPAGRPPAVVDPYKAAQPGFNLGQVPLPSKPLPMPVPGGVDFSFAEKMFDQIFTPLEVPQLPTATPRKAPEAVDLSPFVTKMEELRPKDSRRSPEEARGEKWRSQLAAAGQGAAGGETFGDIVLGASTGFVGQGVEFDEGLREEARFFDEAQRQFSVEMENLRLQAEEARVAKQNALNENDFFNASAVEARALEQLNATRETAAANAKMAAEKLSLQMDIAQARASQGNAAASATYQNNKDLREWTDRTNLLTSGAFEPMSFSPDGRFMTGQRRDPVTGNMLIETVPSSPIGQKALASEFGLAMGLGNDYQEDLDNQTLAQFDPVALKKKLLTRVLGNPEAARTIFDPESPQRDKSKRGEGIGGFFDFFSAPVADAFTDTQDFFTTTKYESAVQKAEKFADSQVTSGAPPERRNEIMMEYLAESLLPLFTPDKMVEVSRRFSGDKVLAKGLGYVQ